jgi:hypothetical protein
MNNNDMRKITREFVEAILTCDIDDNDELLTEQMEILF